MRRRVKIVLGSLAIILSIAAISLYSFYLGAGTGLQMGYDLGVIDGHRINCHREQLPAPRPKPDLFIYKEGTTHDG